MVALVILLMLTEMHYLSFITGLVVGMLTIQVFFHRFSKPLTPDKMPESPTPAEKTHVLCHPGDPPPRMARDHLHDHTVRLGPLYAVRQGPLTPVQCMTAGAAAVSGSPL